MPEYKIAIVQMHPKPLQPEANFNAAAEHIRSAAMSGSQLVVLPEYHLTNWLPKEPGFLPLCDDWQMYLERYQTLAKELNVCIVPGTIVERHAGAANEEDKLLNVAYFIDNNGDIAGKYIKKNLWIPEREHLHSSGRAQHVAFDTPLGKVGMLICWDLAFPEAFRELIAQGAKIIIIPTFWTLNDCSPAGLAYNPMSESIFLDSVLTARAFENTCAIVFANAAGPRSEGYAGQSQVTVPFIGAIERLPSSEEGVVIATLDMDILDAAEENYKVRADLASDDWHYDYREASKDEISAGELLRRQKS